MDFWDCIKGGGQGSAHGRSLVARTRGLIQSGWLVNISHVYREANRTIGVQILWQSWTVVWIASTCVFSSNLL